MSTNISRIADRMKTALEAAETSMALPASNDAAAGGPAPSPNACTKPRVREIVARMSPEVVDSNPYSRLMALQRPGVVDNNDQIRAKTVAIVGLGGVGSMAAEMLTRCGVHRLYYCISSCRFGTTGSTHPYDWPAPACNSHALQAWLFPPEVFMSADKLFLSYTDNKPGRQANLCTIQSAPEEGGSRNCETAGVRQLLLFDYDTVKLANMNRLFFRPEHAGMHKTDAAVAVLSEINPDVAIETFHHNITTVSGYRSFRSTLTNADGGSRVNVLLSCVDNYNARIHINRACLELGMHPSRTRHGWPILSG
jgi:molybdopterin/thiamine biosynthesis adenylyltransferase